MVLEKTPESPLDSKEIKPVDLREINPVDLREINPEYSLEKSLMLGKIGSRRRRGHHRKK